MKNLVILGAGTGGTIMANLLDARLDRRAWQITVVDQDETHHYQPGYLFIPFGIYDRDDVVRPRRDFLPSGVRLEIARIEQIEPDRHRVELGNGKVLNYDLLIVATGSEIRPEETDGLDGPAWRQNIFDFYTVDGAVALADHLQSWRGGRLVVHIVEMPIKCPVAPLEFVFLADWWLTERRLRSGTDLTLVTPLPGAFTRPRASKYFGDFLQRKNIQVVSEYDVERVDADGRKLIAYDEREVPYDLLVTVPTNMGAPVIGRSGMGDELDYVPTDPHTLQAQKHEDVFVIGDATDTPSSKAGSVAHFEAEVLVENVMAHIEGRPLRPAFDGHANCFIESGFGKGILIDFNYDVEPLPGKFPWPGIGPFSLLKETRMNHWGKMMFRWVYWNLMLKGSALPLESQMTMAGKRP